MDLKWSDGEQAFRARGPTWLEENLAAWHTSRRRGRHRLGDTRAGFARQPRLERPPARGRWAAVSWPAEHGGRDSSLWEWLISRRILPAGAAAPGDPERIFLLAPTVFEFAHAGPAGPRCPRMASATDLWCQGWSEPTPAATLAGIAAGPPATRRLAPRRARRPDHPWCPSPRTCAGCSDRPESERHRAASAPARPARHPRLSRSGDWPPRTVTGLRRGVFDDAFLADDAVPAACCWATRAPAGRWR